MCFSKWCPRDMYSAADMTPLSALPRLGISGCLFYGVMLDDIPLRADVRTKAGTVLH